MLVSPKIFYKNCYGKYAIAAVNVFTMEQVHGLFRAGEKADAPFIVQMTPVARNYAHPEMLLAIISAAAKIYPKATYAIHLDHGTEAHAFDAIASNQFNSVMIDASHDHFETNVQRTKAVVEKAHKYNVAVEAELGVLSGVEDDISVDEKHARYTQPDEVVEFVQKTNCDSLAVAVGTSHGAYKFSGGQGIQFDILEEIQNRIPNFPIVLHGGSAVNLAEIDRINKSGGQLKSGAAGVDPNEIVKSIEYGVCKINIATDTRLLWTRVHREFFQDSPDLFDPIIPGQTYIEEQEKFMLEKFDLFGATGKASQIKSLKTI
ncbi:class II fructose-bisphosphate aldolase [Flagellimonas flava]|uniref:class II fructose-bisphosphate aldolase n=1 Tax=Flagellimonas flava TaxID=570519 RepID=UPI003D64D633